MLSAARWLSQYIAHAPVRALLRVRSVRIAPPLPSAAALTAPRCFDDGSLLTIRCADCYGPQGQRYPTGEGAAHRIGIGIGIGIGI
jgi:hypothetical protein